MLKLEQPLYHGTSAAASIMIVGGFGFTAPVYLTSDKKRAEHYAKAATSYLERMAQEEDSKLLADGYAVFTFYSLPNQECLKEDDYSLNEPNQFKYIKSIRGLRHFTIERQPLQVDEAERLRLECFAIGMWRK